MGVHSHNFQIWKMIPLCSIVYVITKCFTTFPPRFEFSYQMYRVIFSFRYTIVRLMKVIKVDVLSFKSQITICFAIFPPRFEFPYQLFATPSVTQVTLRESKLSVCVFFLYFLFVYLKIWIAPRYIQGLWPSGDLGASGGRGPGFQGPLPVECGLGYLKGPV